AIDIYSDEYTDGSKDNSPVKLSAGKVMGLMVAYCDNDGSELRENFIGSESVPVGPKDRGWIDAGLFGALVLIE
ncbi:MAG: CBM9 family sugar-binding protein, partial [Gammaproteobacteria bacterium]|nr:CBM9 family sugar-binding protein [Gammaproteobacteria bacterium]